MGTTDQKEDAFGFGSVGNGTKEKIRQIRPVISEQGMPDLQQIDAIADNAGFVSREVVQESYVYRGMRAPRPEPRIPLNMRVPVSLGNAFQRFCQENRFSYPEALEEVLRRAGLPTK